MRTPDILAGLGQGGDDAVAAAMGPQVQTLAHAQVRRDGGTQPRAEISNDLVSEYAEAMAAGAVFPPVIVYFDGSDYWLADGFHRMAAWASLTRPVMAEVRQGTRRDAVLYSVGANAAHGQRRTNADKRRAVMALLQDEEWRQWSDREIARRCAVSQPFVSSLRYPAMLSRELTPAASDNDYQMRSRRVVRNGTEYTMTPPQRSAAPAQASQAANFATPDELDAAVRSWLVAWDTAEEREAALVEVIELGEDSITFDDLREWIGSVRPRRTADLIQAAARVLIWVRETVQPAAEPARPTAPFVPVDIAEQVEVEPPARLSTNGQGRLPGRARYDVDDAPELAHLENNLPEDRKRPQPQPPARPSTNGREAGDTVKVIDWRRTRGSIAEGGRVLVQMSDGTKNPPWLELDDAGQHWMLDMIRRAQEVRR